SPSLGATSRPEQVQQRALTKLPLLDDLIGNGKYTRRDRKAEHLSGGQIDYELKFRKLHDREVDRFLAFQDTPHIDALLSIGFGYTGAITYQPASLRELARFVNRRDRMAQSPRHNLRASTVEERVCAHK